MKELQLASMSIDEILGTMNRHGCRFLLIGGMNFMLRHRPILTYDADLWIEDSLENRRRCEAALMELKAEWGASDEEWGPVVQLPPGWLNRQHVYSLITSFGALDIFRSVVGLEDWETCRLRATAERTSSGTEYLGLSDEDMLQCQLALSEGEQKQARLAGRYRKSPEADMSDELVRRETDKRERCWNSGDRWRVIEQTIAWVDSQQAVPRNSRQACLANQARLLQRLEAMLAKKSG